jgi:hypothetical protein
VIVNCEAAINWLLREAAEWVGAPVNEVNVTLSKDLLEATMDPRMIEANMKLWQAGMLSRSTVYENLQQGEIARADRTYEEEVQLIEDDGVDLSMPIIGAKPAA